MLSTKHKYALHNAQPRVMSEEEEYFILNDNNAYAEH